jgi:hypothetical protein
VPDTWVSCREFEKPGRTVTFEGGMDSTDSQPVAFCVRAAALRWDPARQEMVQTEERSDPNCES